MQEQINEKTVALTVRSTKLTGRLLAKALTAVLHKMKRARDAPPHGKQTLKQLAKQNAGLSNIEITNRNIKSFEPYARKYGIDFALKKDVSLAFIQSLSMASPSSGWYLRLRNLETKGRLRAGFWQWQFELLLQQEFLRKCDEHLPFGQHIRQTEPIYKVNSILR